MLQLVGKLFVQRPITILYLGSNLEEKIFKEEIIKNLVGYLCEFQNDIYLNE